MTIKKLEAIKTIQSDFESLSNIVLEQLDILESIITSGRINIEDDLMNKLLSNEKNVDKKEVKISEKIVNSIVLYQPVASELRNLMACFRIVISLERMSDLVLNIVNFIDKIKTSEAYEKLISVLHNMTIHSIKMVRRSIIAYINDDREYAVWTLNHEIVFDEMNSKILKKIIAETETAESNKHLLMSIIAIKGMMSDIERIADHATNIAEAAIYSIDGKDIRHHKH